MAEQLYENGLAHQVALLIDGDNLTGQSWAVLTEHARKFGYLAVARLYMDFQTLNDGGLAARSSGFELVHVLGKRSVNGYKSMVDVSLASDAMSILYENPNITTLVIGTGDADFIPLLRHWKRRGRRVVVMANDAKLSGELRQVADEVVTFLGGKNKKRRSKSSRPKFTQAQLRDMIIEVVGNTRLTDRETDQPLVRVDWLIEELVKLDDSVEESIDSEKALISILSDMPEFAPIDGKGRTYLVGDVDLRPARDGGSTMSDQDIFELFAELCREALPSDGSWLQAPLVLNEGKRLLEDGANLELPPNRPTGWFRELIEDTPGVEVRITDNGHMEFRRVD